MPKSFCDTLRMLQQGQLVEQATDMLAELVKQVDETGKPGKLTLTLDFKKHGGAIAILAKVTDKTPQSPPETDLLWATVEGSLSYDNPAQQRLDLQPVAGTARVIHGN